MVTKIGIAAAVALVAFLAAPNASFAASKKDQVTERGPYTPDAASPAHGKSHDFQGGGGNLYKRNKKKHHHSVTNS
jgi:hypothetical protein